MRTTSLANFCILPKNIVSSYHIFYVTDSSAILLPALICVLISHYGNFQQNNSSVFYKVMQWLKERNLIHPLCFYLVKFQTNLCTDIKQLHIQGISNDKVLSGCAFQSVGSANKLTQISLTNP